MPGRTKRIGKAAKDFLTEVDLAKQSDAALSRRPRLRRSASTARRVAGRLLSRAEWVADPLDGTINYATGSPLCGVMLGLLEDGVPTLGVIDAFLGVRVDSGAVADVDALEEESSGWATPSIGVRAWMAYLELTMTVHRRAALRCVGAASVLWAWL